MLTERLYTKLCQFRRLSTNRVSHGQNEPFPNNVQRFQAFHGESQDMAGSFQAAHEREDGNSAGREVS